MEIMGLVVGPMMDLDAAPQTFRLQFGQVDVAQQLNGGRGRPGWLESGSNAWWHAPFRPRTVGVLVLGPSWRLGTAHKGRQAVGWQG